jgi:hypothetical protein
MRDIDLDHKHAVLKVLKCPMSLVWLELLQLMKGRSGVALTQFSSSSRKQSDNESPAQPAPDPLLPQHTIRQYCAC